MASVGVVNIRRDVDDKFYRYRMPILQTKIEGKGNGIKTVLPNISDVARALSRPPTYPTKFFGCELGAQTSFDEKADRYIVNGAHQADRLRELLDSFIVKFVLCDSCKNPETDLVLTKTEHIYRDCKACGQRTDVDMRHKLVTFIVKNPPKKAKKAKKGTDKEQAEKEGNGKGEGSGEDAGSDDEFTKKLKADAAVLPTAEQVEALGSKLEDWSLDTSPEAVRARQKAALDGAEDSEGEDADSPYTRLKIWTEENRGTATAVEVYKKVQDLGIEKKHKSLQVLGQSLFTASVLEEIPKFGPCLKKLTTSERHQKALLGGIERLVGLDHPDAIPKIPKILMELYQVDILEEEVVKQWGTHVSKKYVDRDISKKVRKAAEPFLKWLEEADDDDEEDEE